MRDDLEGMLARGLARAGIPNTERTTMTNEEMRDLVRLDYPLECEATTHSRGIAGHSGLAAYLMTAPCGRTAYMCAGSVANAIAARTKDPTTFLWCSQGKDHHDHKLVDVVFTPLPEGPK